MLGSKELAEDGDGMNHSRHRGGHEMPREYHQSTGDHDQPSTERDRRYTHVDAGVLLSFLRRCHSRSPLSHVLYAEPDAYRTHDWH